MKVATPFLKGFQKSGHLHLKGIIFFWKSGSRYRYLKGILESSHRQLSFSERQKTMLVLPFLVESSDYNTW